MLKEKTPPDSAREEPQVDARWAASQRRIRALSVSVAVLLAVMAGFVWYAYPILQDREASAARVSGIQDDLRGQIEKAGRQTFILLAAAGKQTSDAVGAMMGRVENEIDRRVGGLKSKVASLESSRDSDQTRIAGLQQELNQVRGDVARQGEELREIRRKIDGKGADISRDLTGDGR